MGHGHQYVIQSLSTNTTSYSAIYMLLSTKLMYLSLWLAAVMRGPPGDSDGADLYGEDWQWTVAQLCCGRWSVWLVAVGGQYELANWFKSSIWQKALSIGLMACASVMCTRH